MIDLDVVIKEVSQRTGIDKEVVNDICKHTFQYAVNVMKDDTNVSDILFNLLFKFKLKRRFKENKTQKYSSK